MRKLLFLLLLALPVAAVAADADTLKSFLAQTRTATARFEQTVLDRNMKVLQKASGTMAFSRPGKFRWQYDKPYEQVIVGDGYRLWIYDKDLDQVTERKLDQALGASPAALLAGNNAIEKSYIVTGAGTHDGLDWLDAVPRTQDTAFERIRIGFDKGTLAEMDLRDQFGQTTIIRFTDLKRNPKLPANLFEFTPPEGTDVLRE